MKKINGIALTENHALKNAVRTAIADKTIGSLDVLTDLGFEYDADKKAWFMSYADSNDNKVYATLTLTVGLKAPNEKAEKKSTRKKSTSTETIEID